MDKSKWEYKKLGDCCKVINGLWTGKKPPFINVGVIRNANFTKSCELDNSNIAYIDVEQKAFEKRKLIKGDIIIEKSGGSDKQPVGRPILFNMDGDFSFSNFTSTLRVEDCKHLDSKYLHKVLKYNYLMGHTKAMQSNTTGLHNLDFTKYKAQIIPIPSFADQQRIVAELDCLNEMIALKQEQLKEFDKLAQSIFYDMFGDPIENEKGWKMCLLKDATINITDGDHMPPPKSETGVPFVTISNVNKETHQIDFSDTYFVPKEYYDAIPKSKKPQVGDVLYTVTGSYGIPVLLIEEKEFCFQRHIGLIRPSREVEPVFLCLWAGCQPVKRYADRVATGVAQKTVSLKALRNFPIILPPLALQQQFAEKIQAIEEQKELVKKSIAETQSLLDYTMDKYFG